MLSNVWCLCDYMGELAAECMRAHCGALCALVCIKSCMCHCGCESCSQDSSALIMGFIG